MKKTPPPFPIANPCPKKWDDMHGDAKRRFCDHCQLHVHNLSAMSERERDGLISRASGRLCIAYTHRRDGSIILPSRWDGLRRAFAPVRWGFASLLALVLPLGFIGCASRETTVTLGKMASTCHTDQQKAALGTQDGFVTAGAIALVTKPTNEKSK